MDLMPRPRRSHETRERLLNEGVQALLEHGYHATGVQAVVDRVAVPKGSFYNYFDSKESFGAAVVRRYATGLLARMDAALEDAERDPLAALKRYFEEGATLYERVGPREGCLLCNLGAEIAGSDGPCAEAVAEALAAEHRRLSRVVALAQAAGQVRADVPAGDLAYALLDAWNGALIRMKSERSIQPLRQFCELHVGRLIRS